MQIAIDGPAGAGKSTIAKIIADRLGAVYIDTGAMYRALTLAAIQAKIKPDESQELTDLLAETTVHLGKITKENGEAEVYLNHKDVSMDIRLPEVSQVVSHYSALPSVREKLTDLQRHLAQLQDVVMDGRDIGTVVLPKADFKFYLTASVQERAKRRYLQLGQKGIQATLDELIKEISLRDQNDFNRKIAPLTKAEDAVEIISDGMDIDQVCAKILSIILK